MEHKTVNIFNCVCVRACVCACVCVIPTSEDIV